jgi:hypothetical protein
MCMCERGAREGLWQSRAGPRIEASVGETNVLFLSGALNAVCERVELVFNEGGRS